MYNHPAQQQLIEEGWLQESLVLQLPTGSGKTWLAEQEIKRTLLLGHRVIYLAPIRALAEELYDRWRDTMGVPVGIFTGAFTTYPVSLKDARLLILTPEKLLSFLYSWRKHWGWIPSLDLIVADEIHTLSAGRRGAVLESCLLKLKRLNPFLRVLALSATLGNREKIAVWLGAKSFVSTVRTVPLSWEIAKFKKASDKPGIALVLVQAAAAAGQKTLIFLQSKRRAETLAALLVESGINATYHHAGLLPRQRQQVEQRFRSGDLIAIVATPTLAMGVNLPCDQVILYDLQRYAGLINGYESLSTIEVHQFCGRAGRPGLGTQGKAVLIAPSWNASDAKRYIEGRYEPISSQLWKHRVEHLVGEVVMGLSVNETQLIRFFQSSLAHESDSRYSDRVIEQIPRDIATMLSAEMLCWDEAAERLRATLLAYIAVRHQLQPETILFFKEILQRHHAELTFFDLLLVAASCPDCELSLAIDLEEVEPFGQLLDEQPSRLLEMSNADLQETLGHDGRALAQKLKTALMLRDWTQTACIAEVAARQKCYEFEVYSAPETFGRLLLALLDLAKSIDLSAVDPDGISIVERLEILTRMIAVGLDESAATLTLIDGLGAKSARQLLADGVEDIEDLALIPVEALIELPGIGHKKAENWTTQAAEIVSEKFSANRYRETLNDRPSCLLNLSRSRGLDEYQLRRSRGLVALNFNSGWEVRGGSEQHLLTVTGLEVLSCDCIVWNGAPSVRPCKHAIAVRRDLQDPIVLDALAALEQSEARQSFDLLAHWF